MLNGVKMKRLILAAVFVFTAAGIIYSESVSDSIISKARTLIGTPYRMGGISPSGFDCSGFISYLYKPHVPGLPRVSRDMAKTGSPVSRKGLIPGDLIFFCYWNFSPESDSCCSVYRSEFYYSFNIKRSGKRCYCIQS